MIRPRAGQISPGRTSCQASANQNSRTCATTTGGAQSGFQELPQPKKLVWVWYGPGKPRCAMADNQLDSLMDVTSCALQALQTQNPNVIGHFNEAPYAWVPDPCSRTFELNHTVEPGMIRTCAGRSTMQSTATRSWPSPTRARPSSRSTSSPAYPPLNSYVDKAKDAGVYDVDELWKHDPDRQRDHRVQGLHDGQRWLLRQGRHSSRSTSPRTRLSSRSSALHRCSWSSFQAIGINASNRNECRRDLDEELPWALRSPHGLGRPVPRSTSPGRPWTP